MAASWKQQALIEAPVESVWGLLEDAARFPEWSAGTIDVTGVPTKIEKGSTFEVTGRGPMGIKGTTTFEVEELNELREIKLRCQTSGYYSHWVLTEARGNTFADLELGVERAPGLPGQAIGALHTKRYLRRAAEQALDGLRTTLAARAGAPGATADRK